MGSVMLLAGVLVSLLMCPSLGKPIKGPPHRKPVEGGSPENRLDTDLPYDQYLREVVEVLESDPGFRKKLETANISDIKNGNIAMHLEMVNHTVRTRLDELKRRELARLQTLARAEMQAKTQGGTRKFEIPSHLDLVNPHSFEMEDLKKLIIQTTSDLEELDKKRKEEFKEYEMEKEFEKKKHLNELSEEERKKEEARLEELKKKHADHPKLNHPASKDQFEEVWDKVDHLEEQDFDPKTFFFKHDLNGDFEWSVEEVDAVLQLELDKVYDARNSPDEDDPVERQEEMNRMRQHVFEEIDKNKDYRISLGEFLNYTGKKGDESEFKKDEGWDTIENEPVFSEEDYQKFLESHHGVAEGGKDLKFQSEQIRGQVHHVPPQDQQGQAPNQQPRHPKHQQQHPEHQQQHPEHQQQHPEHQQQQPEHQQQHPEHQEQFSQQELQRAPQVIEHQPGQRPQFSQQEQQQAHVVAKPEVAGQTETEKMQQQIKELQEKLNQRSHH
ncbi:unnamed protein product [Candidula unifasciata]|uniref:EF-hand domain-containing protein n=1 Tax=Candidula unifasciata TaxID=100452 RepID=A0A8S3YXE2_9EUPU|nr:unnamed protein product [Candidula unifasciata]